MSRIKRATSLFLVFVVILSLTLVPSVCAAESSETTTVTVKDLGDGLTVTSTVRILPSLTRDSSKTVVN